MSGTTYLVLIGKRRAGRPDEIPQELVTKLVEDYRNKVLAEVTASQHQELERLGYRVEDLRSKTQIRVGKRAVDPKVSGEVEEAVGPLEEEEADGVEHYFVQFVGPVKPEWLEVLAAAGLTPLSYYHDYAYLVRGDAAQLHEVAKQPFVRAILPYVPNLKLSSSAESLLEEEDAEDAVGEFVVSIFAGDDNVAQVTERLAELGGEVIEVAKARTFYQKMHIRAPVAALIQVAAIPGVYQIEAFQLGVDEDEVADQIVAGNYSAGNQPQVGYQAWLSSQGIDGAGVTIGISDSGTDDDHPAFAGRITRVSGGDGSHGTMVAGQAAANYVAPMSPDGAADLTDGNGFLFGIGLAPAANLLGLERSSSNIDYYTGSVIECVTSAGPNGEPGSIINTSAGYGIHDPMNYESGEREWDIIVRDANPDAAGATPLTCCFSAGNMGVAGLTRPKASKNAIVTGNFENYRPDEFGTGANNINDRRSSSSIGNCGDGRVKPDIVTPGHLTASAAYPQPGGISHWLRYGTGTSAASPKTAGACALLTQWWRQRHTVDGRQVTPSPALLKALIINGAVDTGAGGPIPNNEQGWGRIHLNNVLNPQVPTIYVDQSILLQSTSDDVEFDLEPIDPTQPLKITLVWTDLPGNPGDGTATSRALKNALGLEVTQGTNTWFGNNFAAGWSQTGGVQDAIQTIHPGEIVNNVQNVFIQHPTGTFHVRISPEEIVGNCLSPRTPNDLPWQQDFALAIQNGRLAATEPLDIMLAIDRTGSMSGARLAAAIASGQEFFDLVPTGEGHQAGLASHAVPCDLPHDSPLGEKSTVDIDLTTVTGSLKTDAQALIATLSAGGCTSIGAGLSRAAERIVEQGKPLHRKVLVLLTDGKENRPPYATNVTARLRKEYRVHAIGLGGSGNAPLLQQIASDTGGEWLHTLDADEVTLLHREILALETDEEVVGHERGIFGAGEEEEEESVCEHAFPIVHSDSKATIVVGWKNPEVQLDVELVSPHGQTVTPETASHSSIKSYSRRSTHLIYTLLRPRSHNPDWEGEWLVRIRRASDSAPGAETYTASMLVRSSLRLRLHWDKLRYTTEDLIQLKAQVLDSQNVLRGGVRMTVRNTVPLSGYGAILAGFADAAPAPASEDGLGGALGGLELLSDAEWRALYTHQEETVETTFAVGMEDDSDGSAASSLVTPNLATLKKLFRPTKDGTYTYHIAVEGQTDSGARYTRVRTISKFIEAKVDADASDAVLQPGFPEEPEVLRLVFTPRDLHGNLIGPGLSDAIHVDVSKAHLKGELKEHLDGTYTAEVVAVDRPEDVAVNLNLDGVSLDTRWAAVPVPRPELARAAELEGKVERLRFDQNGTFLGFALQTIDGLEYIPSMSGRLAGVLAEAMEKDLAVLIRMDQTTAAMEVNIRAP